MTKRLKLKTVTEGAVSITMGEPDALAEMMMEIVQRSNDLEGI